MIRLALTGNQLAELYALEAMGVPSVPEGPISLAADAAPPGERSFLFDTEEGRRKLLQYASDLGDQIDMANRARIDDEVNDYIGTLEFNQDIVERPDESELIEEAIRFLNAKMGYLGKFLGDLSSDDHAIDPNWDWSDLSRFGIVNEILSFCERIDMCVPNDHGRSLKQKNWPYSQMEHPDDPAAALRRFRSDIQKMARRPEFLNDFWNYYFDQKRDEYYDDWYMEQVEDTSDIQDKLRDDDPTHFVIDDVTSDLRSAIYGAERTNEREDFVKIMAAIDHLSSISHHGGPAFEYGDTTGISPGPDLIEVMNRKLGDRFLPWLLASGNFPEEHLDDLQEWYEEQMAGESHDAYLRDIGGDAGDPAERARRLDVGLSSEGYYKHPYHSQRGRWLAQHSPTFRTWTPFDERSEHLENLRSIARTYGEHTDPRKAAEINRFLQSPSLGDVSGIWNPDQPGLDPHQQRPPMRRSDSIRSMVRLAAAIDRGGSHDIADRMDTILSVLIATGDSHRG